jgi:hypothetical protein
MRAALGLLLLLAAPTVTVDVKEARTTSSSTAPATSGSPAT